MASEPASQDAASEEEHDFDFNHAFQRLAGEPCRVERVMLVRSKLLPCTA
jgi:hypothetical protein